MLKNSLERLRIIGYLEGASFLLLLGIAMPLKYMFDYPQAVSIVGMAHGVLFMIYLLAAGIVGLQYRWPFTRFLGAIVASITPFGPFIFEARLKKQTELELQNKQA